MFISQRVTVTTTPTRLDFNADYNAHPRYAGTALVYYNRGSVPIYIGGPDVTVATGFQVDPGQAPGSEHTQSEALWAVTEAGTCRVDVLQQRP